MSDVTLLMYVVLAASILALSFAYYFYRSMLGKDEGTELMKTIASHVRKGAMAYLKQQYKVVTIVFVRILLGAGWFLRYEDGYLCLRSYRKCGSSEP